MSEEAEGLKRRKKKEKIELWEDGEMAFVDPPCYKRLWSGKCGFGKHTEQGKTNGGVSNGRRDKMRRRLSGR